MRSLFFNCPSLSHLACLLCVLKGIPKPEHQMCRSHNIICNPLPSNLIFCSTNKFWSSWLWTKFSWHETGEIKWGVICGSLQQQLRGEKHSALISVENLNLKVHNFISVLISNKNSCSEKEGTISLPMEIGCCWSWQSRCMMTGKKEKETGQI